MVESKMQKYEVAVTRITINSSKFINYVVGNRHIITKPLVPYDDIICEFLHRLSLNILKNKIAKKYPDIITFSYWCRKSNINKLKKEFKDGKLRLGLGLVFHIAPSNVPINFAYTFVFGLLAGNSNIVRLPSNQFPQIKINKHLRNRNRNVTLDFNKHQFFVHFPSHDLSKEPRNSLNSQRKNSSSQICQATLYIR